MTSLLKTFGPVWDGAGARGFSKEGYWHHRLVPGLSFADSTFVSKTITTYGTKGNMPLTASYSPREWLPRCIALFPDMGAALNAVGLSGPSLQEFLATGRWQAIEEPFFISYMPILQPEDEQYAWEVRSFVGQLQKALPEFRTRQLGIQFNISCPNVDADLDALARKAWAILEKLAELGLPVVLKLNLLMPVDLAAKLATHRACAGLCMANSIPFGTVLSRKWWERHFRNKSPLERRGFGAGGLSGKPLLYEVEAWLKRFRQVDKNTHINAGGGIMRSSDVDLLHRAGASSIFFATVAMVRPWRVRSIIQRAHELFV